VSDAEPFAEAHVQIVNELGLHARAATRLVQAANRFRAEVELEKEGQRVNGKSIMGVLMLVASHGSWITVTARGVDAEACVAAIVELIATRFGEDR
jgi:phosphocarrier protein HPr